MPIEMQLAFMGIAGTLLGSIVTHVFQWLTDSGRIKAEINEKVLNRRIEAHVQSKRMVNLIRGVDRYVDPVLGRTQNFYGTILHDSESFKSFKSNWVLADLEFRDWCSQASYGESVFIETYFENLRQYVEVGDPDQLQRLSILLVPDFVEMAASLEKCIQEFFWSEMYEIKPGSFGKSSDTFEEEILLRIEKMKLYTEIPEIDRIFPIKGEKA